METKFRYDKLEKWIVRDHKFISTTFSFLSVLAIYVNLSFSFSPIVGTVASLIYFMINGVFLGYAFFKKENSFFKLLLGILLLVVLLGLVAWIVMIVYNLDTLRSTVALFIVTVLSYFATRLKKARSKIEIDQNTSSERSSVASLHVVRILYLSMVVLSFFLLFMARSGEVHTVWEFLHPLFIPVFFGTTFLLLTIILSSEKVEHKVLFTIIHSVLSHVFFVIVFPAGDVGGQQLVLGRTRLVFDNVFLHGAHAPADNILLQIYQLDGVNFQSALSVIFARMFGVDIYWSHSLLVPVLWGVFVPIAAFMTTKALGGGKTVSVLSGLLVSSFPYTVYWGAISVYNSLGFIFFFFSLYFFLKYFSSNKSKLPFLMVAFTLVSFLAHYLTGVISISFLLLAVALRKYEAEKSVSPTAARALLLVAFIFCTCLLPMSLIYQELIRPFHTHFGLDRLFGLSTGETVSLFLFGEYVNFSFKTLPVFILGPLLGLLSMIYFLGSSERRSDKNFRVCAFFLFMGFFMVLIDYRILKLFMVNVPFNEERLWLFRDFIAVLFVAIAIERFMTPLFGKNSNTLRKLRSKFLNIPSLQAKSIVAYILILLSLSGWVTASVYYGYPHLAPLQTTSYEVEAVKYTDKNTTERYVVICDQWLIYAGQMFIGINNPRAFYFYHGDSQGIALFIEMKENPSPEPMIEAMKTNNATVAYFIVEEPRLGTEEYNRIVTQAQQKGLQKYQIFYYGGEEKLRIFYYKKSTD